MKNKKISKPTFDEEEKLLKKGYNFVIGTDEVGRGSFAGPITVAAVVFAKKSKDVEKLGINDSKLLKSKIRECLSTTIKKKAVAYSTATIELPTINKVGIGKATQMAFRKAIKRIQLKLRKEKIFVLIDGFHVKYIRKIGLRNQKAIIKGDGKSISIAAASIIAKVYRDNLMTRLDRKYPNYKFSKNKGYGTKEHQFALKKYGLSKVHRTSFSLQKFLS